AGRAKDHSLGLLQTYAPDLPVMQALVSADRDRFYAEERDERLRTGLPPYGRLAALIVSGEPNAGADAYARTLAQHAPPAEAIEVLGPAEAPIAMIRGRRRYRLLLKATRTADVQGYLRQWLEDAPPPRGGVRVAIDIDPQTFM
ncbi:MAG: primosomal protein N', partial [Pseudomonadota bacterium]